MNHVVKDDEQMRFTSRVSCIRHELFALAIQKVFTFIVDYSTVSTFIYMSSGKLSGKDVPKQPQQVLKSFAGIKRNLMIE